MGMRRIGEGIKQWCDPAWFHPDQLAAVWKQERMNAKLLRLLTMVIVLMLVSNAVTVPFAISIDSLGIEAWLSFAELNMVVGLLLFLAPVGRFLWRGMSRRRRAAWMRRLRHWRVMRDWLSG